MAEDNDLLLRRFFEDAARQQIADDGFTERVMQQIARQQKPAFNLRRFNTLWTVACVAVFAALFVVFRGWELLAIQLEVLLRTTAAGSYSFNPLMLAVVFFGLLFVGVGEVITSERRLF